MGHYLSEMGGLFDPSPEQVAFGERIEKMRELLAKTKLSRFTADYAYDICMVMNQRLEYKRDAEASLKKLEDFFKKA